VTKLCKNMGILWADIDFISNDNMIL